MPKPIRLKEKDSWACLWPFSYGTKALPDSPISFVSVVVKGSKCINPKGHKENAVDSAGSEENEVRTGPERGGNAAARPGRKNNVVVIGRLQAFDHRRQRLRRRDRQMGEKPVNVRAAAVALRDKRDVRVLAGEVPAQRCRQRDRVFIRLPGNRTLAGIVEYNAQLALVLAAELPHFERTRLGGRFPVHVAG